MKQLQKIMYKQEYDRLMNQPVNEITKLELECIREYLRENGTEETEKGIACLEQAMQTDEDNTDLYQIFRRGLSAVGDWEQVRETFSKEYEAQNDPALIRSQENYILSLLEQIAENKITAHTDYLEKT